MQVNTKFLVCSLIYMGSLSANAVGSSSLANETCLLYTSDAADD